jgi:hypothetical protein
MCIRFVLLLEGGGGRESAHTHSANSKLVSLLETLANDTNKCRFGVGLNDDSESLDQVRK